MKLKLKFMMPNLITANQVRGALRSAAVEGKHIHFLAKEASNLGDLNLVSKFESTNVVHEAENGFLYGMGLGLLAGLYVLIFPEWITVSPSWYSNAHWYVVLAVTITSGAFIMAIGAALFGLHLFNIDLKQYKKRIDNGEILMIIPTSFYKASNIRKIVGSTLKPK